MAVQEEIPMKLTSLASSEILSDVRNLRDSGEKVDAYGDAEANHKAVSDIAGILYTLCPTNIPSPIYSLTIMILLKLVRIFSRGFNVPMVRDNYVDLINYSLIMSDAHSNNITQVKINMEGVAEMDMGNSQ